MKKTIKKLPKMINGLKWDFKTIGQKLISEEVAFSLFTF